MKILVLPHELGIGGSQRNAIDLALEMQRRGDDVLVAGPEGPLGAHLATSEVAYAPLYVGRLRPSPRRSRQVRRLVETFRPDVVHAYEWPSVLEASMALAGSTGTGLIGTVMSMEVDDEVLRDVPLLLGTTGLQAVYAPRWRAPVGCCEPPVDTTVDHPDPALRAAMRRQLGIGRETPVVAIVSRIARRMKFEGIAATVRGFPAVFRATGARLVIAGSGDASTDLTRLADATNAEVGTSVVTLLGEQSDPHPVYSAADVVVGMGGSALRALAHGVPVVVAGEAGFVAPVTPDTMTMFGTEGFYGIGDGTDGAARIAAELTALLADDGTRVRLGTWSRALIEDRYALGVIADGVRDAYIDAIANPQTGSRRERMRALVAAGRREFGHHVPRRASRQGTVTAPAAPVSRSSIPTQEYA